MLVFAVLTAILYAKGAGVENLTGPADDTGFDASAPSVTDLALRGTTDLAAIPPATCTALALLSDFSTKNISIIPTFLPKELQVYSTTCPVASAYWKNAIVDDADVVVVALEDSQVPLLDLPQVQDSLDVAPPADVCVTREDPPVCDIDDRPFNTTISFPLELGGGFSVPSVTTGDYVLLSTALPFGVHDFFTPDPPYGLNVRKTAIDAPRDSSQVYKDVLSLVMDLYAGTVSLLSFVADALSPMVVLALVFVALSVGLLVYLVYASKRKVSTRCSRRVR